MKNQLASSVLVYADWVPLEGPALMGVLTGERVRGKEVFSFEYDPQWLNSGDQVLYIDPNLGSFSGRQYAPLEQSNFGLFLDSAPDRWGRFLMRSREALIARSESRPIRNLYESDYLLGVHDGQRMGGLRFRLHSAGEFLSDQPRLAAPPWTTLRALEQASLCLEKDEAMEDPDYSKWLGMLLAPGSSLGGARPKAGVLDEKGHLWIAKFPSHHDEKNSGAWEMVVHQLAQACSITVPMANLIRFSGRHHTFLSKRFDRAPENRRIHFASAMTLLGHQDGDNHAGGASYLELAEFILRHGAAVDEDLEQLWRRVAFNVLVSNTDDHLRNHGFLLNKNGWRLSPAYDMNPDETGAGLTLNIDHQSNHQELSLVLEIAPYFRLGPAAANRIIKKLRTEVRKWRTVAKQLGIGNAEIERTANAFRLAD